MRISDWSSDVCSSDLSAVGSARLAPNRRFTGADLFDLAIAADPQISPDRRHIAYVRRANAIMSDRAVSTIWLIDTRTGEETPVAARQGGPFSPRWSPEIGRPRV